MKAIGGRAILALAVLLAGVSLSGCSYFDDREDMPPDPDPSDGVYLTHDVIKKMDAQRKSGKWRQQY